MSAEQVDLTVLRTQVAEWWGEGNGIAEAAEILVKIPLVIAETERLRKYAPSPAMEELLARSSFGTSEAEAARESVSPDAGRAVVRLSEVIAERDEARTALAARDAVLGAVTALVDGEVADDVAGNIRHARANVRCLDCNLRYEERQDYSCGEPGYGHDGYTDEMLADAEAEGRAQPVEYITIKVADLRAVLAPVSGAVEDDDCASCGEIAGPDCAKSQRSCGHHCNHSWEQDVCHWCGVTFGENGEETPAPVAVHEQEVRADGWEVAFKFQDGEVLSVDDVRAGRGIFDQEVPAVVARRAGDDEWIELGDEFLAEYDLAARTPGVTS